MRPDNKYDSYYWENKEDEQEKKDENMMTITVRYHLDIMLEKLMRKIGKALKDQASRIFGRK